MGNSGSPTCDPSRQEVSAQLVSPAVARATAKNLATELKDAILSLHSEAGFPITNILEVLSIGAMVTKALAAYSNAKQGMTVLEEAEQLCRVFGLGSSDVAVMEDLFCRKMLDGTLSAEEIREGIHMLVRLLKSPVRQRQMIVTALDEIIPPGKPGTLRKIERSEVESLTIRAQELSPMMRHFLRFREEFPSRSLEELVQFLAQDYLEEAAVLIQNIGVVKSVLEVAEFAALKTANARAQYMADAVAGAAFQLTPSYAHEVAEEGRRSRKKRTRGTNAEVPPEMKTEAEL